MRHVTVSDTPSERRIYERAAREEESFLMTVFKDLVETMPPPKGWHEQDGPGRPRKHRPGHQEEFPWQTMTVVLMLKTHHQLTDRETTSHLNANPGLRAQLGIPRGPSPKTIQRALDRLPEAWLKELNRRLVDLAKKGARDARQTSKSGWTLLE